MSLRNDWFEEIGDELRLPDVIAERCVHSQMELATCRHCVDSCPLDAWVIDDEQLGIDANRCDGCGLCVPACPQQAIVQEQFPAEREWQGRSIAMLICEHAGDQDAADVPSGDTEQARVRCLHAFGVYDVLRLYRHGVRHWMVCHGDCGQCPRYVPADLERTIRRTNRLLKSRGLPRIAYSSLPLGQWRGAMLKTGRWASGPQFGRRGFFGSLLAQGADRAIRHQQGEEAEAEQAPAPGRFLPLPPAGEAALYFHVPHILADACNGCDACMRLCPQQALAYNEEAGAYVIHANDCNGCGICIDACDQEAIVVNAWEERPEAVETLPLRDAKCSVCGCAYHRPAAQQDDGLCAICSQVNHHRNLFQVLS